MTDMARLFVAVVPPTSVISALADLPRPALEEVRWTRPEQWHITLRFLGQASVAAATHALESIDRAPPTATVGPAVIRLGNRIAALPVEGLDALAESVALVTDGVAEAPSDHDFRGHITLARSRKRVPEEALGAQLATAFDVTEVHLVQSHLDVDGPRYELLSGRDLAEELQ